MLILDGKVVAASRNEALKKRVDNFTKKVGRDPHLVVVLVGQNPASQVYVRNKVRACEAVGIKSTRMDLTEGTTQKELNALIDKLNKDDSVDGVLVQLPLPKGLSEEDVNRFLDPMKDSDGFTYESLGHLWAGHTLIAPCTPQGVMNLLAYYKIAVAGKNAVVIGRSNIVGKPMAHLLTMADATVTICHSKTKNLAEHTLQADIVVVAAGKKNFLGKESFKKGAVVIDVGMHGSGDGKGVTGDVRFSELEGWAAAATPVPGGVGPMTIATLLENTVALAEKRNQQRKLL